jgi:hypothetical protein
MRLSTGSGTRVDEGHDRHALDATAQKGDVGSDGTIRGVWKAVCLEAYEMLEEIALGRHRIRGHQSAAQEAWRRITTYVAQE